MKFSNDGGKEFGQTIVVSTGNNVIGRVDTVLLEDGSAIVSWIEFGDEASELRVQRIHPTKTRATTTYRVSNIDVNTSPKMVRHKDRLVFSWIDSGYKRKLQSASSDIPAD